MSNQAKILSVKSEVSQRSNKRNSASRLQHSPPVSCLLVYPENSGLRTAILTLNFQSASLPHRFQTCQPSQSYDPKLALNFFLCLPLSIYVYVCVCVCVCVCVSYWFYFFWITLIQLPNYSGKKAIILKELSD